MNIPIGSGLRWSSLALLAVLVVGALSSCALLDQLRGHGENPDGTDPRTGSQSLGEYRLKPGSRVFVVIYRNGQVQSQQDAEVDPNGDLSLDGVGGVSVEGMRALDAAQKVEFLARSSGQNHLGGPRVHFNALDRKAVVHVSGGVARPGPVTYHPKLSIADAILTAGGATGEANPSAVGLTSAGRKKIATSLQSRLLKEGDIINVPGQP